MKLTVKLMAILVACGVSASGAAFTNGNFESPGGTGATFLPNGNAFVTGWVHTGNTNGEFYTDQSWGILAGDGTHYIGWGASGATGGILSQTFDTVVGATYQVDYLLTTQQLAGSNLPLQSNSVQALDGSTVLAGVTNSFNMAAGNWLAGNQLVFTATSGATTLRFTDTSNGSVASGINWGLDAVSVTELGGSTVPEPATYALVLTALGALALRRRQ
jgi:hypothetical protein